MSALDPVEQQLRALDEANRAFAVRYPGPPSTRQPVHSVYVPAQHFSAATPRQWGALALRSLDQYAADPIEFAVALGMLPAGTEANAPQLMAAWRRDPQALRRAEPVLSNAFIIHERVRAKLQREPLEDLRIDFEDGFGTRPDPEEDAAAERCGRELGNALAAGELPAFSGIRIKCFSAETVRRGMRTIERFVAALLIASAGRLPPGFVITLPKVTVAEQPRMLVRLCERLEQQHGLPSGALRMEFMIEVSHALIGPDGRSPLPGFLAACEGRCSGVHLGTYDYSASCHISPTQQRMDHPLCDLAKGMMLLAFVNSGVFLSDGSTNMLPVGPHPGSQLSAAQALENRDAVHAAWRLSYRHIQHSLAGAYYQGWDLHPAQLPVRFASCYAFYLSGFASTAQRLRRFLDHATNDTRVSGAVLEDPATGQELLNFLLRAQACGAIESDDLLRAGLRPDELAVRSLREIIAARRA
jgi:citrate lyase beta subunit